jgi:hypothetical protein
LIRCSGIELNQSGVQIRREALWWGDIHRLNVQDFNSISPSDELRWQFTVWDAINDRIILKEFMSSMNHSMASKVAGTSTSGASDFTIPITI